MAGTTGATGMVAGAPGSAGLGGAAGAAESTAGRATSKAQDVRLSNITAAKAVADAVRTSLGPRGMDKMVQNGSSNDVLITNDGATILDKMSVEHPAAKMLVELAKSQDIEAGDGTTTVTILCGSLLKSCLDLLEMGIHPTIISEGFQVALQKSIEILESVAIPVDLAEREALIKAASTSLNSKVVAQHASLLAPMAVDAVLSVAEEDPLRPNHGTVDLSHIRIVTKGGGTIDDSVILPNGLILNQGVARGASGPTKVANAKVALIQFQLSPPKTDVENSVVVSDYAAMDRILREERQYILGLVKKIKATGCTVLLIQKSILRDAVTDLSLHFLAKTKIMVVTDIERNEIEFISRTLGCVPVAGIDSFTPDKLASVDLVEQVSLGHAHMVQMTGIGNPLQESSNPASTEQVAVGTSVSPAASGKTAPGAALGVSTATPTANLGDNSVGKMGRTVSILVRGSNNLVLDEAERSLHDALCVIRSLVKKRFLIAGGGAPETELSVSLAQYAKELSGMQAYCVKAYAAALEIIPYTLAENAGLNPIEIVTELRKRHAEGQKDAGINVRKGTVTNIVDENVVMPLFVITSALSLATECVRMILKIDDVVLTR